MGATSTPSFLFAALASGLPTHSLVATLGITTITTVDITNKCGTHGMFSLSGTYYVVVFSTCMLCIGPCVVSGGIASGTDTGSHTTHRTNTILLTYNVLTTPRAFPTLPVPLLGTHARHHRELPGEQSPSFPLPSPLPVSGRGGANDIHNKAKDDRHDTP
jgi:hypothetical protein